MSDGGGLWGQVGGFEGTEVVIEAWYSRIDDRWHGTTWVRCKLRGGRADGETRDVPVVVAIAYMAAEMPK